MFFLTFFTENHKNRPVFLPNPCKTDVCFFVCFCKCIFEKEKSANSNFIKHTWQMTSLCFVALYFLCTIIFCRPFLGISKNIKFLVLNAYERVHTIPLTSPRIILNTGLSITHVLYFLF